MRQLDLQRDRHRPTDRPTDREALRQEALCLTREGLTAADIAHAFGFTTAAVETLLREKAAA